MKNNTLFEFKHFTVFLFLLSPFFGQSQNIRYGDIKVTTNFDSLKKLEGHQTGIDRFKTLLSLQKSYLFWFQADTKYLNIIETLIKESFPSELHILQCFKGHHSIVSMGNYQDGFHSAELSFKEFEKREDIEGQVYALTLLGIISQKPNNPKFKNNKKYLRNAYLISQKSSDNECILLGQYTQCRLFRDTVLTNQSKSIKMANSALVFINQHPQFSYLAPLFYDILSMIYISKKNYDLCFEYESLILNTYKKNIDTIPPSILSKNLRDDFPDLQKEIMVYFLKKKDQEKEFLQREKEILKTQNKLYIIIYIITFFGLLGALAFTFVYKRKNALLKIANEEIIRFNKLRVYFLGIIAHDLRQPLMAFNGITETFKFHIAHKNYSVIEKLVSAVDASGKRLQHVLDNLLSWAYSQKDEIPYNPTMFNLYNLIHDTLSIYEYNIGIKNISVQINCDEELMIFADRGGIALIIRNLVANALKSVKQDTGKIMIEVDKVNETKTQIKITDNGQGIEESKFGTVSKALAFPNNSQPGESGLGLGILLVSRFIQRYNGKIEVKSSPKTGTTFIVFL